MNALVAGEWLKMRTVRAPWVLVGIAVGFPLLVTLLVASFAPLWGFDGSREFVEVVTGTSTFSMLFVAVAVAIVLTGEYGHGTIRVTYVVTPSRRRVLGAKAVVGSVVAGVIAVLALALSWAAGALVLGSRGLTVGLSLDDGTLGTMLAVVAFAVVVSWFAIGMALLVRGTALTVTLLLVYPLIIEPTVAGLGTLINLPGLGRWMPFGAGVDAASVDPGGLGRPGGLVWFAVASMLVVVLAALLEQRRDA